MSDSNEASEGSPRRLGSYTTARVTGGRVERVERHARRLRRDAERLGLPPPERADVERGLREAARQAFGWGDGIVRIEWSRLAAEPPQLITSTRPLGADSDRWSAITSKATHPGPGLRANTKHVAVDAYDRGRAEIEQSGCDEALLFDEAGCLVEGARSNLIVVTESEQIMTPAFALGGVEGLGLSVLLETHPEIKQARLTREDLASAREILAVNAVRGVVAIIELDGASVGTGRPGPEAARLGAPFGQPRP